MSEAFVFFLHGSAYAGLLFLVSSGLALVFGMMNVLNFAHAAKPLGLKAKFACYFLNDENTITAIANDDAVIGSATAEVYMLTIPGAANQEFVEGFKKAKGYYSTWLRGKACLATMMWAEAVRKAGSTDVDAVRKAWEGLRYVGPATMVSPEEIEVPCDRPGCKGLAK